jgi:hypothetical protein
MSRRLVVTALATSFGVALLGHAMASTHCDIPQRLVWDCRYGVRARARRSLL